MGFGRAVAVITLVAGLSCLGVLAAYCAEPVTASGLACSGAEVAAVSLQLRDPRRLRAAALVLAREEVLPAEPHIVAAALKRLIRMEAMQLFHRAETAQAWCGLTKKSPRYWLTT